jgi:hypothetical protein
LPFGDLALRELATTLTAFDSGWTMTNDGRTSMDNLTYELRALCRRNRDGSHATQADRITILTLVSRQLLEAGFRRMQATSLKRKHVEALLERWLAEGLSPGTIKNRMAALRWWAQKVGNAGAIPADNAALGVPDRRFVTNDNKAQQVDTERMREIAARAETLPHEIQEVDARIVRLRERLKAGDPDLMADELQAGIERAENKRRELLDVRPAERENARVLALMPRAAELYREQIDLGLGGDPAAAAKARTILREMLGEITLSPGEDGSLWAEYAMQPAALLKDAVCFRAHR